MEGKITSVFETCKSPSATSKRAASLKRIVSYTMHLLFVCSRNQWRSPTAEALYRNHHKHQARSAGTASSARVRLSAKLIEWADIIFVMEHRHKQIIQELFRNEIPGRHVVVLDIADEYSYMDPELVDMIRSRVDAELEQ